jgi:hypothetical protein
MNNETNEQKQTELFIKDQNLVLGNIDYTVGLTHISNLNLNGFIEIDYETFKNDFLVNEVDNKYVYSKNQKIKYDKNLIDLSILAVQNFLHNEKKTQLKFFSLNDTKVFINPNEPMPIIFVFNSGSYYSEKFDFALIVAPNIESD